MTGIVDLARGDVLDDAALGVRYAYPDDGAFRVNMISSLDGAATAAGGLSGGLGGSTDRRVFAALRALCDVVLVAAGTVRAEGYDALRQSEAAAADRVARGLAPHPVLAIVSGSLSLGADAPPFVDPPVRPIVFTAATADAGRRHALASVADVVTAGEAAVGLPLVVAELRARGLTRVLCEGGPSLLAEAFAADVVDELCLTLAPRVEAGGAGRIARGIPAERGFRPVSVLQGDDGALALRSFRTR